MRPAEHVAETLPVPRTARFPIELHRPQGFEPGDPRTWPRVQGRLEYVGGRLLYMPPSGQPQSGVAANVVGIVWSWAKQVPGFRVGANEAGMKLGPDVRAADAAVWRVAGLPAGERGLFTVAPVLAVEVAGLEDDEEHLREKARWYLDAGVRVVWLIFPDARKVIVLTAGGEQTFAAGERLGPHSELPGLAPQVDDLLA